MPRALLYGRFAVYAAVLALGGLHFVHRHASAGDAHATPPPEEHARILTGTTPYGGVRVGVYRGQVKSVAVQVRGRCRVGRAYTHTLGFVDAYAGDFARYGRSFADSWLLPPGPVTEGVRMTARLDGSLSADGRYATGHVTDVQLFVHDGLTVDVCSSHLAWSASA